MMPIWAATECSDLMHVVIQPLYHGQEGIFKQSTVGLNSKFSFSKTSCLTKTKEFSLPYYLLFDRFIGECVHWWVCSPMVRETGVQFQVESYQRLKKWYLMPLCLTLSIIRYWSRVKWSNPGKELVLFPTLQCSSYWKGSHRVNPDYRQLFTHR